MQARRAAYRVAVLRHLTTCILSAFLLPPGEWTGNAQILPNVLALLLLYNSSC